METVRIRDGKKSDPGSGINISDPQHWLKDPDPTYIFLKETVLVRGTDPAPDLDPSIKQK